MMARWSRRWYYWLLLVLLSWLVLEVGSIIEAHLAGDTNIFDWTLSETIRRWTGTYAWLAPVAIGTAAFLGAHFFLEKNPSA